MKFAVPFFSLALLAIVSATPMALEQRAADPSPEPGSQLEARASGSISAYLWVADCSGSSDYTWDNDGTGCYSYNGNTDMYSIGLSNYNAGCGLGTVQVIQMFHKNFGCSGLASDGEIAGSSGCHTLGSTTSIKSFRIQCSEILAKN